MIKQLKVIRIWDLNIHVMNVHRMVVCSVVKYSNIRAQLKLYLTKFVFKPGKYPLEIMSNVVTHTNHSHNVIINTLECNVQMKLIYT